MQEYEAPSIVFIDELQYMDEQRLLFIVLKITQRLCFINNYAVISEFCPATTAKINLSSFFPSKLGGIISLFGRVKALISQFEALTGMKPRYHLI